MITFTSASGLSKTFEYISFEIRPSNYVTEHPVERGAEVSDNIQRRADRFLVELAVTNSPLGGTTDGSPELAAEAFFEAIANQVLTVSIRGQATRRNIVLEEWPSSRNHVSGRPFRVRMKQIRVAESIGLSLPSALTDAPGTVEAQSLGPQSTTTRPSFLVDRLGGPSVNSGEDPPAGAETLTNFLRGLVE